MLLNVNKLLHTPDSLLLADCIALANALAVAQGKSQDDSPVEEGAAEALGTHPVDIPNSLLSTLTMLNSNSVKMLRDPSHQYLGDPRILAAYLRNADDTSKEWSPAKAAERRAGGADGAVLWHVAGAPAERRLPKVRSTDGGKAGADGLEAGGRFGKPVVSGDGAG